MLAPWRWRWQNYPSALRTVPLGTYLENTLLLCATTFFASARACETVSVDAAAAEAPVANNAPAATAAIGAATFLVHVLDIRLRARVTRKSSYRELNSFAPFPP